MTDLTALARRVEEATEEDRELDRDIGLAIGGWKRTTLTLGGDQIVGLDVDGGFYPDHPGSMYPSFTSSLDAVVSLVERLGGVPALEKNSVPSETLWDAWVQNDTGNYYGGGPTAPLALLLAAVRALGAK